MTTIQFLGSLALAVTTTSRVAGCFHPQIALPTAVGLKPKFPNGASAAETNESATGRVPLVKQRLPERKHLAGRGNGRSVTEILIMARLPSRS